MSAMEISNSPPPPPPHHQQIPAWVQYVLGGISGMTATLVVQPIDLIKTRMQLSGEGGSGPKYKSSFHAFISIAKDEGKLNLYKGLSAGLLRQATYGTTRLGSYNTAIEYLSTPDENGKITPPNFGIKLLTGMLAGAVGAVVGTPAEVALVRMTSDGRLPADKRRGYSSVFNALKRIALDEGVLTLWRGCGPTVSRAVVLNAAQLATYGQVKEGLLSTGVFENNLNLHFIASLISGFVSTAVSIPIDMAKTRIQTMEPGKYKNSIDCIVKTAKAEGVLSLWKGFTPYFLRLGPHTIITFMVLEQLNKALR